MTATILDGKSISLEIRNHLTDRVSRFKNSGIIPGLATVITYDDGSIGSYVSNKDRVCREAGIYTQNHVIQDGAATGDVVDLIYKLNCDSRISGILVQLPLRQGLDEKNILESISPYKDVDGLTLENQGRLYSGCRCLIPCTAKSIIRLIEHTKVDIAGKHAVVVGRSNIVGKPAASLLMHRDATVTICHSKTPNLAEYLKNADIIVSAAGKPGLIGAGMVKYGAVVIDAGTRIQNGRLTGDVKFHEVAEIASWITPVPGGVGSMTTTMLIENILEAAECLQKC